MPGNSSDTRRARLYPLYSAAQTGWVIIASIGAVMAVSAIAFINTPLGFPWPVMLIFGAFLLFFYRLTITVDDEHIHVVFGLGLKVKSVPIGEIAEASAVENKWWHGYGIRMVNGGVMYNVSGLKAVLLTMKNGYTYRLGTEDPNGLLRAIRLRLENMRRLPQ